MGLSQISGVDGSFGTVHCAAYARVCDKPGFSVFAHALLEQIVLTPAMS